MLPHAEGPIQQSADVPQSLSRLNLAVTNSNVGDVHLGPGAVVMGADKHCLHLEVVELLFVVTHPCTHLSCHFGGDD